MIKKFLTLLPIAFSIQCSVIAKQYHILNEATLSSKRKVGGHAFYSNHEASSGKTTLNQTNARQVDGCDLRGILQDTIIRKTFSILQKIPCHKSTKQEIKNFEINLAGRSEDKFSEHIATHAVYASANDELIIARDDKTKLNLAKYFELSKLSMLCSDIMKKYLNIIDDGIVTKDSNNHALWGLARSLMYSTDHKLIVERKYDDNTIRYSLQYYDALLPTYEYSKKTYGLNHKLIFEITPDLTLRLVTYYPQSIQEAQYITSDQGTNFIMPHVSDLAGIDYYLNEQKQHSSEELIQDSTDLIKFSIRLASCDLKRFENALTSIYRDIYNCIKSIKNCDNLINKYKETVAYLRPSMFEFYMFSVISKHHELAKKFSKHLTVNLAFKQALMSENEEIQKKFDSVLKSELEISFNEFMSKDEYTFDISNETYKALFNTNKKQNSNQVLTNRYKQFALAIADKLGLNIKSYGTGKNRINQLGDTEIEAFKRKMLETPFFKKLNEMKG